MNEQTCRSLCIFGLLLAFLSFLTGCENSLPPGTVAEVNGEPIGLHAVQALMDSRTGAMGIPPKPSVAQMRRSYAQAAGILIIHALVRQELAKHGLAVSHAELDEAIAGIKADYGPTQLQEFMADASVREGEWRQLVLDHLSLESFVRHIIDPSIRISRDEIRAWYNKHEADFKKPETWRVCFKTGSSEEELENWCAVKLGDAKREPLVQCQSVFPADVPQPWQNEFKKLAPGKCGKIIRQNDQWNVVALLSKEEARIAKISEVYPLIENAIMAEKRDEAFEAWVKEQLAHADVKAMPELFQKDNEEEEQP